ncbi:DUF4340 domain-containing protein [Teredinibacter haidensis]|uniref:DUF4340 domain-containing protein n=1 Tax=Teredinibacter haidensis TaxID=2731755 RepID=UPI0009490CF6|nr:DUF4340 domain-containing protein [Teredinibacter haidensis]
MNKAIQFLTLLLVLQVVLVLGTKLVTNNSEAANKPEPLAKGLNETTELVITDGKNRVRLTKDGEQWRLPDYGRLLVSPGKMEELLQKLSKLKAGWPVASSSHAAERFEVAEDNAQKTLELSNNGKRIATLYLGTSPSYRKVHVRVNDEQDIHIIELAQHEAPAEPELWFDKTLLGFEGLITEAKTDSFTLTNIIDTESDNTQWFLSPSDANKALDNGAIDAWIKRFNNLLVNKLMVDGDAIQSIVIQNPVFTINLKGKERSANYAFYSHSEKLYVKQFGQTPVFEIASYQADPIIDMDIAHFYLGTETPGIDTSAK